MPVHLPKLLLTSGEPAGIGPDLCVMLAHTPLRSAVAVLGNADLLRTRAHQLGKPLEIVAYDANAATKPLPSGGLYVVDVEIEAPTSTGQLDIRNVPYVISMLRTAIDRCLTGEFLGIVTAPVHKGVINEAGTPFTGHTEFLAEHADVERVVMMLTAGSLRVALATTHLALREVPDAITRSSLRETLQILNAGLRQQLHIPSPRILVCGLNPHAGEGGHLGTEDRDIVEPTIEELNAQGMRLIGPVPADTAFIPQRLTQCDAVLAMYHDQGLPVLKYVGFGNAVNITLGLPFVRTSVDHGTALELAGSGRADPSSLYAAIEAALVAIEQPQAKDSGA